MRKSGWIVAAATVAGLAVAGWARAQEPPDEEEPPSAERLLAALILETRGVRQALGGVKSAVASAGSAGASASEEGASDLGSVLKQIRDALRPGEIVVVKLPGPDASPEAHAQRLQDGCPRGYRLVAVSEGFAYFQK